MSCLLVGGPTLSIHTSRGEVLFEDHPYCGPMPVTQKGIGRELVESHPFWTAMTEWYADGKPLGARVRLAEPARR